MPVVLAVPVAVLVVVAIATWRLDRRLHADVRTLDDTAGRLASLRAAVQALGAEIDRSARRRRDLAGR